MNPKHVLKTELILDDFERKHVVQTLRKKPGDSVMVTDGQGTLYSGIIRETVPKLKVQIQTKEKKEKRRTQLMLACGFIKQNRMDFILEKGTELGVNTFHFFRSYYANYFSVNTVRFQKIVRQALKQSLRFYLPEIQVHASLNEFFNGLCSAPTRFIAIDSSYPNLLKWNSNDRLKNADSVTVAIGPEGGFVPNEIEQFTKNGFSGVSLGTNRLRTETAAIAAVSIIKQFIN